MPTGPSASGRIESVTASTPAPPAAGRSAAYRPGPFTPGAGTPPGTTPPPAPGPPAAAGAGERRGARRAIVVVLVLMLVVAAAVALGRGDGERRPEALGAEIGNAAGALDEAERVMREAASLEESAVADDAACWFVYPAGSDQPHDYVLCGPVLFLDSDPGAPYVSVPVTFERTDDGAVAIVEDVVLERSVAPGDDEMVRPDGKEPPAEPGIDLPDPPPAESGRVEVGPGPPPVDLAETPDDGRLVGAGFSVTVDAFEFLDHVRLPDETVLSAADGEEWLVAEVSGQTDDDWTTDDPTFSLVIDGRREELDGWYLDESTSEAVIYASVPADAGDVALSVSETELEQSWSFTDQERSDDAPEVYYRDLDSFRTDVNVSVTLPFAVDAVDDFRDQPFGEDEATITVGSVHLGYLVTDANERIFTPGGPDKAFVWLEDTDISLLWGSGYGVPADRLVLTTDAGEQITATHLSDNGSWGLVRGAVAWEVPADVTGGTITVTMGRGPEYEGSEDVVDFQDGVVTVPFTFG